MLYKNNKLKLIGAGVGGLRRCFDMDRQHDIVSNQIRDAIVSNDYDNTRRELKRPRVNGVVVDDDGDDDVGGSYAKSSSGRGGCGKGEDDSSMEDMDFYDPSSDIDEKFDSEQVGAGKRRPKRGGKRPKKKKGGRKPKTKTRRGKRGGKKKKNRGGIYKKKYRDRYSTDIFSMK